MTQPHGSAQMVPYETPEILLHCSSCDAKFATYELTQAHEESGECRLDASSVVLGRTLCRMSHAYGTKAAHKTVFRVVAAPDPKARRKAEREGYAIEPAAGGPRTRISIHGLIKPLPGDERFADVTPAVRLVCGHVVTANSARFGSEVVAGKTRLVVLKGHATGEVDITLLGGYQGRSWSKVARNLLSDPLPREEV